MILPKIKVLRSHGRQYIPDLNAVELTEEFRGRPVLTAGGPAEELRKAAALCPTGAIATAPSRSTWGAASSAASAPAPPPGSIRFTNDYRMGSAHARRGSSSAPEIRSSASTPTGCAARS